MFENPFLSDEQKPEGVKPKERSTPKFERALTETDREYVRQGLQALWEEFETVPKEKFPDLIIFLDTSARPLAAGALPIVREVAKERGLPEPNNRFLAGTFRTQHISQIMAAREEGGPDWKEAFIREHVANEKQWMGESLEDDQRARAVWAGRTADEFLKSTGKSKDDALREFDEMIERKRERLENADRDVPEAIFKEIEELEANEKALSARLSEILAQNRAKHVLIIDDYLSKGLTLKQVLAAFRSLKKENRPDVTFMSFFAKQVTAGEHGWEEEKFELRAEDEKRAWIEEGFEVLLPTQEWRPYTGFVYNYPPDPFDRPVEEEEDYQKAAFKKSFVGVEKIPGEAIAKRSEERDTELMLQLRHEIRDLAKEVLSEQ